MTVKSVHVESDLLWKEELEADRQSKIHSRYKSLFDDQTGCLDRFEKIYVMEGVTLMRAQVSRLFQIMLNALVNPQSLGFIVIKMLMIESKHFMY